MDPQTAFLIATLMMLLNGGVLGLMHHDLPESLRPSALSWRIGTLLQAAGCVLLTVQRELPAGFVLPLANGLLMLGITGYWRALRQFYGQPDSRWLLLPAVLGTAGIWWFAALQPSLVARILIASLVWSAMLLGCAWSLHAARGQDAAFSARVLRGIFLVLACFMLGRSAYFLFTPDPGSSVIDGGWINMVTPMIAAILPVTGTTAYLLLCSERIRRDWERAASTDYLTGLANRRTLAAAGAQRLQEAQRNDAVLAVALIDIDHFKAINDRFGHDTGDAALKHVAQQLRLACKDDDLLARQGGEEFVAVLTLNPIRAALHAAETLRQAVSAQPFAASGSHITITVSVGIAILSHADRGLDDLLRRADHALYAAKTNGRDRVELTP